MPNSQFSAFFSRYQRWLGSVCCLTAAFSVNLVLSLPSAAIAATAEEKPAATLPASAVSLELDLGDLLRNTIRFVQVADISNEEEVAIGEQINDLLLRRRYQLYPNPQKSAGGSSGSRFEQAQVNRYVERVGQALVASSNRRDIPYTFQVVVSDNINAFATPGGFVYVTTGLLRAVDNEAQLSSVLAHEIAHINERHSVQALQRAVLAQGIAETVGLDMNTLAQVGYQLAVNLPRSREFEYEADRVGLEILQKAGYPPTSFVNFLEELREQPYPPEFLRTHPTTENRIEAIAQSVGTGTTSLDKGLSEAAYQRNVLTFL